MGCCFFMVEHTGFEPVTSTLPVLRAPNCANAPKKTGMRKPAFVAEKQRFELWNPFTGYTISSRAPSTN